MTTISIEEATPNMTVAENVLAPGGAVFMKKGTRLTRAMLDTLRARGISQIQIQSVTEATANKPADIIDVNLIEGRFQKVRGDEIMETLLAAVIEYRTQDGNDHGA